jgi:hypothetical protein
MRRRQFAPLPRPKAPRLEQWRWKLQVLLEVGRIFFLKRYALDVVEFEGSTVVTGEKDGWVTRAPGGDLVITCRLHRTVVAP